MKLESVKLVNFNVYEDSKFVFKPGLNLVVLPNGGGKTTLIEGISFAIYGSRILEDSVRTYIREGSVGSSLVKLVGEFQGTPFELTRYLKPTRVLFKWGSVEIKRVDELTDFWKSKLIPGSLFKATICCNQREATLLAQAPPALRRKMISELLRFDVVTEAIKSLSAPSVGTSVSEEQITKVRKELKELEVVDDSLESFHREQLYLLEQEALENKEVEQRRNELSNQLASLTALVELLSKVPTEPGSVCPVCNSVNFDVEVVRKRYLQLNERLNQVRRELMSLPMSTSLSDAQRSKIDRKFSVDDHRTALMLIERKKKLEASLASLLSLQEQLKKNQVYSQARRILREFLDSTSVPLLTAVSKLSSKLLSGSPFNEVILTPSFDLVVDGRPFNKFSTGQKDFIAVVFRVAVSYITSAVYGIGQFPLLLDSIGDSLDENYFSLLMTILSTEVTKLFPQIIMTTHHA